MLDGQKLRQTRLKKRLTQGELAMMVGIAREYVAMMEAGTRTPSLQVLARVAKVLGVSVGGLLDGRRTV